MIGSSVPTWTVAVAPFGALALLLFAVAIRSGRWGVWLAGYVVVVLALAIALVSNHERDSRADAPEPAPPPAAQPSAQSGVIDRVSQRLGSGEVT
jgi:peptidoglycan/LPS O-acetylase OafA/YrhL